MFGLNKNKYSKKISTNELECAVVCDKCNTETNIQPKEVVLGNFRYWFVCPHCGKYVQIKVEKMTENFKRYLGDSISDCWE